jgi:hypothetical protein
MKSSPRLLGALLLTALAAACGGDDTALHARGTGTGARPAPTASADRALAAWQRELLQLAFDAASAFPLEPHRKNRSAAQHRVVDACFELGQPELAVAWGRQLADWRRGCAYADFAWCRARAGDAAGARDYVALAEGVVRAERDDPNAQAWRGDLIRIKCARALAALGDEAAAAAATAGIEPASAHAVDGAWAAAVVDRVQRSDARAATVELAAIDAGYPSAPLGHRAVALATVVRLHERFHADTALRTACTDRVVQRWTELAPALRLSALERMARTALANGDRDGARALVAAMRGIVEQHRWRPQDGLPQQGRLVELTHALGDHERARADLEQALAAYHRERDAIASIDRAEALRPLAFAAFACGDAAQGQQLLALVLEEGVENPNSRPRCDDLVDTCLQLCTRGIEPSPAVRARIGEIRAGLADPW